MLLTEREIVIPALSNGSSLLAHFSRFISEHLRNDETPVRFAITQSDTDGFKCELGILSGIRTSNFAEPQSIFDFARREIENTSKFNAVMIVPTGIGAEIGGHAGDATPAARLLAAACDTLITHPNVVNASDINELPENGLYVEGSVLSRFIMGAIGLKKVRANRVLLVIDKHEDERLEDLCINAASAARGTLGLDCPQVIKLELPIKMKAK